MANFVKNMDDFGITKTFTIGPNDWNTTTKTYVIEDDLITVGENESAQFISYNPALYNDTLYEELCNAGIRINSVSNRQIVLKCTGDLPVSTLYITVTFKATYSPSVFTIDSVPTDGSPNPISSDGVYSSVTEATHFMPGEMYSLPDSSYLTGALSNSNKTITFSIPLPKKSTGSITVNSFKANIRMGVGGYAAAQSSYVSGGYDYLSYINRAQSPANSYYVILAVNFSSNVHGTNNQAISIEVNNLSITFN